MDEHNALVRRGASEIDRAAYEPKDVEGAFTFAKWAVSSGFFGVKSPEQAVMIMAQGRELGLSSIAALQGIDLINGRPSLRAQTLLAIIRSSPKCRYVKMVEDTPEKCTWETLRTDDPTGQPSRVSFTLAEANALGLTGRDQWKKQPQVMLGWRALSKLARREYSDVLFGVATTDEALDDVAPVNAKAIVQEARTEAAEPAQAKPSNVVDIVRGAIGKAGKGKAKADEGEIVDSSPSVLAQLEDTKKRLVEMIGLERAKAAWHGPDGPGQFTARTPPPELERRLDLASSLLERVEIGEQVNKLRAHWRDQTGEIVEPIEAPELSTLDALRAALDVEESRSKM